MKTILAIISPVLILTALSMTANLQASDIVDREPTTVEFLEGKVYRLSVQLEEVCFQLKDRSLTKLEKKTLKLKRRQLKRELS
jgi:hypothetical protein